MNVIKWIGIIFFTIGTIIATIAASKVPSEGQTYPNTLPLFFAGTILAIIGVIGWHMAQRKLIKEKLQNKDETDESEDPLKLMEKLQPKLKALDEKYQTLDTEAMMKEVDHLLDNYILPIANIRDDVKNTLGLSKGSVVLITLAYGERTLNRVWSAAADNHIEEARKSYPEASQALKLAWDQASQAFNEISTS